MRKKLNLDVRETWCWGIDIYTRKNLIFCLPMQLTFEERFKFV